MKVTETPTRQSGKSSVWETILRIVIAVASAIAGAIGSQAIG